MKTLSLIIIILTFNSCFAQTRYFQAMYQGQDSITHAILYGTYYFATNNNYFPDRGELNKKIIEDYKLNTHYKSTTFSFIIHEFKNKKEYLKYNKKL